MIVVHNSHMMTITVVRQRVAFNARQSAGSKYFLVLLHIQGAFSHHLNRDFITAKLRKIKQVLGVIFTFWTVEVEVVLKKQTSARFKLLRVPIRR